MKRRLLGILSGTISLLFLPITAAAQTTDDGFSYTYRGTVDPTTASQIAGALGIGSFIVVCIAIILIIVMTIWVYKDAKKRNANVALWTILTFLLGIVGLIIYLLAGRKSGGQSSNQPSSTSPTTVASN